MLYIPFNASLVASRVWQNVPRTLTTFGGAVSGIQFENGVLAAATGILIGMAGISQGLISAGVVTGAAGPCNIQINDGTNNYLLLGIVASSTGAVGCVSIGGAIQLRLVNNDVTNTATYAYSILSLNP